ncbi:hypothetical protein D6783_04405 [Candidatus Woesearchaeota archaeon]|nr:MAG: hypothetical protein D6783_04405 [Candidatus Woesearchaeota archaeon]
MKHSWSVTISLVLLFFVAQVVGLFLLKEDLHVVVEEGGVVSLSFDDTVIGERPELSGASSFLYLVVGVGAGTLLLLLLIRFRRLDIWKWWFLLAVFLTLSVALGVVVPWWFAFLVAALLAWWKVFRPSPLVHNVTEVLMYAGLAVLLVPLFDVFWASVLLVVMSGYDMFAVWFSKHMVKMAKFQASSGVFAGLMLPSSGSWLSTAQNGLSKGVSRKGSAGTGVVAKGGGAFSALRASPKKRPRRVGSGSGRSQAMLGGGDVVFPLLFSGAVLQWLVIERGVSVSAAFVLAVFVSFVVALSLLGLFLFAKKERFYPAMPFLTAGCFVGWLGASLLA